MSISTRSFVICSLASMAFSLPGSATSPEAPIAVQVDPPHRSETLANPVDIGLIRWFTKILEIDNRKTLTYEEFEQLFKDTDDVTRTLALLHQINTGKLRDYDRDDAVDMALAKVNELAGLPNGEKHVLFPYLLAEINLAKKVQPEIRKWVTEMLREKGENSCPRRQLIKFELDKMRESDFTEERVKSLLQEIAGFHSENFRRDSVRLILRELPEELQPLVIKEVKPFADEFPDLAVEFHWIPADEESNKEDPNDPEKLFDKVTAGAIRGHCQVAKDKFIKAIDKVVVANASYERIETVLERVEDCFRSHGRKNRDAFLKSMKDPLKNKFGFDGEEIVARRVALALWARDDFDTAVDMLLGLRQEAQTLHNKRVDAGVLFTLGRIEENRNSLTDAINYYKEYVAKYPESENYNEAVTSLIVLLIVQSQDQDALVFINQEIDKQSKKNVVEWDNTPLPFALFWGGRLNYKLGNEPAARNMLKRVSSEFYSTFYGAVGHYMLERIENQSMILEPSRNLTFHWEDLYARLGEVEKRAANRAMSLVAAGLKSEATCELSELAQSGANYDRDLAYSMLRYAMGDWLLAIKRYSNLPHTYRHNLPVGMERILFPRAFADSVKKYAQKVDMDPDFIYAIIRQESVFNPRAMSPVGATGLMQLMPGTARREMKKIRSNYLSNEERHYLSGPGSQKKKLFDPDINIALGVHHVSSLMKIYKNPVFVLSAYNANPKVAAKWMKNIDQQDLMTFIERVPYRETRAYIKLVLRNYFYYKRWYQDTPEAMVYLEPLLPEPIKRKDIAISKVALPNKSGG